MKLVSGVLGFVCGSIIAGGLWLRGLSLCCTYHPAKVAPGAGDVVLAIYYILAVMGSTVLMAMIGGFLGAKFGIRVTRNR